MSLLRAKRFQPSFWDNTRDDRIRLLAYWDIAHATGRQGAPMRKLQPADLRILQGRSATLGDIAEAWMLTHPTPEGGRASAAAKLRASGASPKAADWWAS